MKDKAKGVPTVEFAGLKSKMYSYIEEDNTGDKKTKRNKKCLIKNAMKYGE